MNVEHLATRIRAEFLEMPGLRLTHSQAERLWGLDTETCSHVVALLIDRAVLRRRGNTISLAE
jgi:hypothetical protein